MTGARLSTALRCNIPMASSFEICSGMCVLVYRERLVDQWQGLYSVQSHDGRQEWLDIMNRRKLFSVNNVKAYLPPLRESEGVAAVTPADHPSGQGAGGVIDAIISSDTLLRILGQRLGSIQEKAYRDTIANAETPSKV